MSEVDSGGTALSTFNDVKLPTHLTLDTEGRVFVVDCYNHRILLLNRQLQLERVLVGDDPQDKLCKPKQSSYDDVTSQLYVLYNSSSKRQLPWSDVIVNIVLR